METSLFPREEAGQNASAHSSAPGRHGARPLPNSAVSVGKSHWHSNGSLGCPLVSVTESYPRAPRSRLSPRNWRCLTLGGQTHRPQGRSLSWFPDPGEGAILPMRPVPKAGPAPRAPWPGKSSRFPPTWCCAKVLLNNGLSARCTGDSSATRAGTRPPLLLHVGVWGCALSTGRGTGKACASPQLWRRIPL